MEQIRRECVGSQLFRGDQTMKTLGRAFLTLALAAGVHSAAAAQERVQVGTLNCDISAGLGLIIASQKQLTCIFTPAQPGPQEMYQGVISKFGLDLGATAGGQMVWAVYAPTNRWRNALAGRYAGVSAEATVGAGVGANVLVGGSERTVTLQPLSVQGQVGLNVAAGVAELELRPLR
jgi:hypothetical protein